VEEQAVIEGQIHASRSGPARSIKKVDKVTAAGKYMPLSRFGVLKAR
jgi:hypothetical protein